MSQKSLGRLARRAAFDILIGFVAFIGLSLLAFEDRSNAGVTQLLTAPFAAERHAAPATEVSSINVAATNQASAHNPGEGLVFRQTDRQMALIILASVFSLLVAFNLAFFRHLRRAYAPRRSKQWRR